jgi:hypothetical protein
MGKGRHGTAGEEVELEKCGGGCGPVVIFITKASNFWTSRAGE